MDKERPSEYSELCKIKPQHQYIDQVEKDIERSLHHFDSTQRIKAKQRKEGRVQLRRIIDLIFTLHPELHYIQGFHDICSVFLLVCGEEQAFYVCERVSLLHFKDILRNSLDVVLQSMNLIFPIVERADAQLGNFLNESQVKPFFCLSWVLTWFAHNIERFANVTLLYDFFLANHPLMPIYSSAALILMHSSKVLKIDCDYPTVHQYFQRVSKDIDVQLLIATSQELFQKFPPTRMIEETKIDLPADSPFLLRSVNDFPKYYFTQQQLQITTLQSSSSSSSSSSAPSSSSDSILHQSRLMYLMNSRFYALNTPTEPPSSATNSSPNLRTGYLQIQFDLKWLPWFTLLKRLYWLRVSTLNLETGKFTFEIRPITLLVTLSLLVVFVMYCLSAILGVFTRTQ